VTPTGDELVLVAEDEPALRLLIARALRVQGYRVLEAGNGVEALGIVEGHEGAPIALLVTDVTMPKMSGRDLARQVALLLPQLKVLFLSGYSDGSIASDGQLAPGVNFMQKPFSMEALARRVRSVLDS
jgi:CheY-like chemotaxis protein